MSNQYTEYNNMKTISHTEIPTDLLATYVTNDHGMVFDLNAGFNHLDERARPIVRTASDAAYVDGLTQEQFAQKLFSVFCRLYREQYGEEHYLNRVETRVKYSGFNPHPGIPDDIDVDSFFNFSLPQVVVDQKISQKIVAMREKHGLTVDTIAGWFGIRPAIWRQFEAGLKAPPTDLAHKIDGICRCYGEGLYKNDQ